MGATFTCHQQHQWTEPLSQCPVCGAEPVPETVAYSPSPPTVAPEVNSTTAINGPPNRRGQFTVLRLHARGGLGQVSVAQDEQLHRRVALKELRPDRADDSDSRQRFVNEAEITGQLEHPGIVPVYALGQDEEGPPYYAMRFIHGRTLAEAIRDYHRQPTPLACRELLGRFQDVCQAVAFAHSRGVIHRDLKPANVMLGEYGETLVVDWGLAKAVGSRQSAVGSEGQGRAEEATGAGLTADCRPTADSGLTQAGQVLGTPAYMAPEQAKGRAADLGPAADIYALGAILYEVLTGNAPYGGTSAAEVIDQVRQGPPPPPGQVKTGVPRALEAVCLKAMNREPAMRYASASELAQEVERWLADEPVLAYPEPRRVRLARWQRRHRAIVTGAVALLGTAVVALTLGIILIGLEQAATRKAQVEAQDNAGRAQDQEKIARERANDLQQNLYASEMNQAFQAWANHNVARVQELLQRQRPKQGQEDLRGFEWYYLQQLTQFESTVPYNHTQPVTCVAFSPDETTLASGAADGGVKFLHVGGKRLHDLARLAGKVWALTYAPDGKTLAVAGETADEAGFIRLYDVSARQELATLEGAPAAVRALAFSADGQTLASGGGALGKPFDVQLWDVATRKLRRSLPGHSTRVAALAFSPDGRTLVSASGAYSATGLVNRGEVKLWDPASGQCRTTFQPHRLGATEALAFSPDGKLLVTGGPYDRLIKVWAADTLQEKTALTSHSGAKITFCFSRDGKRLISAGSDTTLRVWDVATWQEQAVYQAPSGGINHVAVARDGTWAATAANDNTVRLWDLSRAAEFLTVGTADTQSVVSLSFSGNGRMLAAGTANQVARLLDPTSGDVRAVLPRAGGAWGVSLSPNGQMLAEVHSSTHVKLWDVTGPKERQSLTLPRETGFRALAFSTDGQLLAVVMNQSRPPVHQILLWDVAAGREHGRLTGLDGPAGSLAFSPDGRLLAAGGPSGLHVSIWDVATLKPRTVLPVRGLALAFSPDGSRLAIGGGAVIYVQDTSTWEVVASWPAHTGKINGLAFGPDGKTLASASEDGSIILWHLATRRELVTFRPGNRTVWSIAFAPDGRTLAAGTDGGAIHLWRAAAREMPPDAHVSLPHEAETVYALALTPDGATLAAGGGYVNSFGEARLWDVAKSLGDVRLWDLATGQQRDLPGHGKLVYAVAVSPDGAMLATGGEERVVRLWDLATGRERLTLRGCRERIVSLAYTTDGATLATAGGGGNSWYQPVGEVRLWDTASGQAKVDFPGVKFPVYGLALSPDGRTLAVSGGNSVVPGGCRLWDLASGRELPGYDGPKGEHFAAWGLAFPPDGKGVLLGCWDGSVRRWDWTTRQEQLVFRAHRQFVVRLRFAPDGRSLVSSGADGKVTLWDWPSGWALRTLNGNQHPVLALLFSPDGKRLITGGGNVWAGGASGELKVWPVRGDPERH